MATTISVFAARHYFSAGWSNKAVTELTNGSHVTIVTAPKATVVFTNMGSCIFYGYVTVSNANVVRTTTKWGEFIGTLDCGTAKVVRLKGITVGTVIAKNARTMVLGTNLNSRIFGGPKTKLKIK